MLHLPLPTRISSRHDASTHSLVLIFSRPIHVSKWPFQKPRARHWSRSRHRPLTSDWQTDKAVHVLLFTSAVILLLHLLLLLLLCMCLLMLCACVCRRPVAGRCWPVRWATNRGRCFVANGEPSSVQLYCSCSQVIEVKQRFGRTTTRGTRLPPWNWTRLHTTTTCMCVLQGRRAAATTTTSTQPLQL